MGWTTPRDWTVGEIVTEAIMDTHVKDNLRYLKGLDGAVTLSDALILPDGAGYYIHIPSLTTAQREALTPTNGMIVYDSTLAVFYIYENTAWVSRTNLAKMVIASQATGDLFYASSATAIARLGVGTALQVLRTNAGATAPEWAASGALVTIRKTADETVNNSTTMQDDNELVLPVLANEIWRFEMCLKVLQTYTDSAHGFKFAFTIPEASAGWGNGMITSPTLTGNVNIPVISTSTNSAINAAETALVRITYTFVNGNNAGNVQLQWAQVTAKVSDTKVLANSYIVANKLN